MTCKKPTDLVPNTEIIELERQIELVKENIKAFDKRIEKIKKEDTKDTRQ
jgi:hypothetical protein